MTSTASGIRALRTRRKRSGFCAGLQGFERSEPDELELDDELDEEDDEEDELPDPELDELEPSGAVISSQPARAPVPATTTPPVSILRKSRRSF